MGRAMWARMRNFTTSALTDEIVTQIANNAIDPNVLRWFSNTTLEVVAKKVITRGLTVGGMVLRPKTINKPSDTQEGALQQARGHITQAITNARNESTKQALKRIYSNLLSMDIPSGATVRNVILAHIRSGAQLPKKLNFSLLQQNDIQAIARAWRDLGQIRPRQREIVDEVMRQLDSNPQTRALAAMLMSLLPLSVEDIAIASASVTVVSEDYDAMAVEVTRTAAQNSLDTLRSELGSVEATAVLAARAGNVTTGPAQDAAAALYTAAVELKAALQTVRTAAVAIRDAPASTSTQEWERLRNTFNTAETQRAQAVNQVNVARGSLCDQQLHVTGEPGLRSYVVQEEQRRKQEASEAEQAAARDLESAQYASQATLGSAADVSTITHDAASAKNNANNTLSEALTEGEQAAVQSLPQRAERMVQAASAVSDGHQQLLAAQQETITKAQALRIAQQVLIAAWDAVAAVSTSNGIIAALEILKQRGEEVNAARAALNGAETYETSCRNTYLDALDSSNTARQEVDTIIESIRDTAISGINAASQTIAEGRANPGRSSSQDEVDADRDEDTTIRDYQNDILAERNVYRIIQDQHRVQAIAKRYLRP